MTRAHQLLLASVWHKRETPKKNEFTYRVFYVHYQLSAPVPKRPRLLSLNRFNILSLHNKDLGARNNSDWLSWITNEFTSHSVAVSETDSISIITHPRLFGYAFNPISFWLLKTEKNELKAVLCEVHNTFKDSHNYLLTHKDLRPIAPLDIFTAPKNLYVSPFNSMEGEYTFSFTLTDNSFKADINYWRSGEAIVRTAVVGNFRNCSSPAILRAVVTHPLMTIMVVVRIHWQAIRLFFKKVEPTLKQKPGPTVKETTVGTYQESKL